MGRYSEPTELHADWWDPDESAKVKTKLSFAAAQRVAFHSTQVQTVDVTTEEGYKAVGDHMTAVLFELLDSWTLRKPGTPYKGGADRPQWDLTTETIQEQPVEDITYLFQQGMTVYKEVSAKAIPSSIITPDAALEGL